jgi:hypothetical protein
VAVPQPVCLNYALLKYVSNGPSNFNLHIKITAYNEIRVTAYSSLHYLCLLPKLDDFVIPIVKLLHSGFEQHSKTDTNLLQKEYST